MLVEPLLYQHVQHRQLEPLGDAVSSKPRAGLRGFQAGPLVSPPMTHINIPLSCRLMLTASEFVQRESENKKRK